MSDIVYAFEHILTFYCAAYWIAFGAHGPRAQAPADEGRKVFLYTLIGVGVSFALFATMRMFAKPPPSTMTKEWQEASNEYLKVSCCHIFITPPQIHAHTYHRNNVQNPSPVSPPPATRARVWFSRRPSTKSIAATTVTTLLMMIHPINKSRIRPHIPFVIRTTKARGKLRYGVGPCTKRKLNHKS